VRHDVDQDHDLLAARFFVLQILIYVEEFTLLGRVADTLACLLRHIRVIRILLCEHWCVHNFLFFDNRKNFLEYASLFSANRTQAF